MDLVLARKPLRLTEERRPKGHRLVSAGWTLRVAGTLLGVTGWLVFGTSFGGDHAVRTATPGRWLGAFGGAVLLLVGLQLLLTGRRLVAQGRHCAVDAIDSFDTLQGTRYVLYLRPFVNDVTMSDVTAAALFFPSRPTQEQALVRRFARFGRVVAIGRPGELLPPVGAVRGQLPLDDWHGPVSRLIAGAQVVLMAAGPGPGTVWEFTEAVRLLEPSRLVLLIYCDADTYDRFRKAVASEYKRRSIAEPGDPGSPWPPAPLLPDHPRAAPPDRPRRRLRRGDDPGRPRREFVPRCVITFGPEWRATFVRLDPTTRRLPGPVPRGRLDRRALRPVMRQLDGLPPPRPAPDGPGLPDLPE